MQSHTKALVALMTVQAVLGLLWPTAYRDSNWIKATWFGNDLITLFVAAPLMWVASRKAASGSIRAELVWLGSVGYAVYNYAFYVFGAALNVFLPLYVITIAVAIVTLASALARIDPIAVDRRVQASIDVRWLALYLILIASGLSLVWIAMWAAYVFAGRPTPVDPEAFKIVAALDLLWLVPSLGAGGALLWNRRPWGFVIATAATVQGAIYLLVLSVNSTIAIRRGLAASPAELPIWEPLTVLSVASLEQVSVNETRRSRGSCPASRGSHPRHSDWASSRASCLSFMPAWCSWPSMTFSPSRRMCGLLQQPRSLESQPMTTPGGRRTTGPPYRRRFESTRLVPATPEQVFDFIDDHARFTAHMMTSSSMMAGGRMTIETDANAGGAVGSHITMSGRVLGIRLFVDEVVTKRLPPRSKEWETVGTPRLLVIGRYRMGAAIGTATGGSSVSVVIEYDVPSSRFGRVLGWLLGDIYARWCVRQMLTAIAAEFID